MTQVPDPSGEIRPLESLGISENEERVYRGLLSNPDATAVELAAVLGLQARRTQRLLELLEDRGLATHTPERPRRYVAAAPDLAIERLIMQRQEGLHRARSMIGELLAVGQVARPNDRTDAIVEKIISNRAAEQQVLEHGIRSAREHVLSLVRPPLRVSRLDLPRDRDDSFERRARERGVAFHTVVDAEFLEFPGMADTVRKNIQAGEEVRVAVELPLKMMVIDRRVGLIPLDLLQPDGPALMVRSSPMLDALVLLFEQIWERAAPMSFSHEHGLSADPAATGDPETDALVRLLAAGLNDKVIARELGVSVRTVERRVADLMGDLGARSRFQSGWLAALHLRGDSV